MGFQNRVNLQQAPAVAGDFASSNPRATVIAPEAGFVAGAGGVVVGKFAWVDADGRTVHSYGSAPAAPDGFVHREENALITTYLGESSNVIPVGFPVILHRSGDFFGLVEGSTAATKGAAVYAGYSDGSINIGSAPAGFSATGSIGATFTATGSGTDLTTSVVTGLISIGDEISGTGVPAGTTIVSQTSGTTGGAGVYVTSVATTASAATVTSFGIVLNITAVASGTVSVGDPVSGTGVPSGAVIASSVSGTSGGVGIYKISVAATAYAASTTLTGVGGVLTTWTASLAAAVGELTAISK